ncbi:hypothetical protein H4S07_002080, partial [Coemansia furcata]
MGHTARRNSSSSGSNGRPSQEHISVRPLAASMTIDTATMMRRGSLDAAAASPGSGGGVQGGRMTKLTHYGRMRSVAARALRLADPRVAAAALQTAAATTASHQRTAVMGEDHTGEELLGRMRTRSRRL